MCVCVCVCVSRFVDLSVCGNSDNGVLNTVG
jgi:hypothetical protein